MVDLVSFNADSVLTAFTYFNGSCLVDGTPQYMFRPYLHHMLNHHLYFFVKQKLKIKQHPPPASSMIRLVQPLVKGVYIVLCY